MSNPSNKIPSPSIDWQLVEGVFNQATVLVIGGLGPLSVYVLIWLRSRLEFFFAWGVLIVMVLVGRLAVNAAFARRIDGNTRPEIWRRRFLVGAWLNGAVCGIGAAYSVLATDAFTQMLNISMLSSCVMGSAARNSLYPRAATGSTLLALGPLLFACLASGDRYYLVFSVSIVLYTIAALSVTRHLYQQTVQVLTVNEDNAHLMQEVGHSNRELAIAARSDKLTGLPNRALFMERLEQTIARVRQQRQGVVAVLFLDFDRFKLVNDTLGHEAGDELLRQIAVRLQSTLRIKETLQSEFQGNVVSRFGGDEFLVILDGLDASSDAVRVGQHLLDALSPAYDILGREVHSSASIGIVTSDQCQGGADEMVRDADVAMYEAKRAGRACSVVFNESMRARLTRHVDIEDGLRLAIERAELRLVFQPIVELATGNRVSVEALIRWQHQTLGEIAPDEFIPIAEESELILTLGRWVQREACKTLVEWRVRDPEGAPGTVSVNVSRAELALGSRFLAQIHSILTDTGLPPYCLQLEITERDVMRDPDATRILMQNLHDLGIQLAMDDFGTGTSSLAMLRDYPFDLVKVDRSFIESLTVQPEVLAVIHAIVSLVENLGMCSLAEGVEHAEQVAILQSLGCRYAQGHYFSHPLPADSLMGRSETGGGVAKDCTSAAAVAALTMAPN